MSAQAERKLAQHGAEPTHHNVRIVYEQGKQYQAGQELEVQDYPPENLKVGDTIAFIPEPAGELRLTFEYGSNFTHENTRKYEILDQQPRTVIREMSQLELSAYEDQAKREAW